MLIIGGHLCEMKKLCWSERRIYGKSKNEVINSVILKKKR